MKNATLGWRVPRPRRLAPPRSWWRRPFQPLLPGHLKDDEPLPIRAQRGRQLAEERRRDLADHLIGRVDEDEVGRRSRPGGERKRVGLNRDDFPAALPQAAAHGGDVPAQAGRRPGIALDERAARRAPAEGLEAVGPAAREQVRKSRALDPGAQAREHGLPHPVRRGPDGIALWHGKLDPAGEAAAYAHGALSAPRARGDPPGFISRAGPRGISGRFSRGTRQPNPRPG